METVDGVVRRKLNFNERSFALKSFYVDIRSVSIRNRVVKYIHDLGGSIETFLSKEIHVFVTDTKYNKRTDRVRQLNQNQSVRDGSSYPDSPSPGGNCLPLSRGKALLLKARAKGSDNSSAIDRGLSSNVMIQKATDLGLKIEHVNAFLRKCKSVSGSFKLNKSKSDTLGDIVPLKWDNDSFLVKIEDASNLYKPLHKQFDKLPIVDADNGGGSPFDGPVVLEKTESIKSVKKSKSTKFYNAKGGYCEMCDFYFKAGLREHLLSDKHKLYVEDESNFTGVETIVSKLPNLSKFLAKFCIPQPIPSEEFDNRNTSEVKSSISSKYNNVISTEDINNNIDEISVSQAKDSRETAENVMGVEIPMEEADQGDIHTSDTIIYEYDEELKGDNPFLPIDFPVHVPDIMDVVDPASNMFSDDSVQYSQTDVVKNMISNWTLKDECILLKSSTMSCSSSEENELSTPSSMSCRVVQGLPKPFDLTSTFRDSEPEFGMSFSTPNADDRSLLGDIMSSLKKRNENVHLETVISVDERTKPQKRKHDEECVYFSKKTDGTKLKIKLCKVTPGRQKTNLKNFWKVRKTGECRLVFSASKSKKPLHDSNDMNIETSSTSPHRKRQRLIL